MADGRRSSSPRDATKAMRAFASGSPLTSCTEELEDALLGACRAEATNVLADLLEVDVERLCGERWKRRPRARFTRAGWCDCSFTLAGHRVETRRPRVRSTDGKEIELPSFRAAAERDLLDRAAVEDVVAAVTTGTYPADRHAREPIAESFVSGLAARMCAAQATHRGGFDIALLIAQIDFPDQSFLGAVGIDHDGQRKLAGLRAGSTKSSQNVEGLIEDLLARHRATAPPAVFVVGEDRRIHESIRKYFGASAVLHRSTHDKRRRVLGLLPPVLQRGTLEAMIAAYRHDDWRAAKRAIEDIHASIVETHPLAAAALADGVDETLTLHRLGGGPTRSRRGRSTPPPRA